MNEDRWRRIEELYHAARLLNDSARVSFLAAATEGDEELRQEVESLLLSGASSPGLLDEPLQMSGAHVSNASSLSGRRIGTYSVHERIGAGGMGEVYRAHDSKLRRDVAFKVLAADLIGDDDQQRQDHLRRFRHEAHALAALNHPNIAAIYGLEETDGVTALVMELVDGSTLADRIMQGAIPVEEALPVAKQIAEALEAAHERGIVHRDLKPANIKLRSDGTVKVLDFGLAKAVGPAASARDVSARATTTAPPVTAAGIIVGTAAYMSPEQAAGKAVDHRADIWAFGCVLFEMLTGRAAFGGETLTDTLAAVMRAEPDWSRLPAATPPRIRVLLLRCLDKDTRSRLQATGEARIVIKNVLSGVRDDSVSARPGRARLRRLSRQIGDRPPDTGKPRTWRMAVGAAAAVVLVLAIAGWWVVRHRRPAEPPRVKFTQLTNFSDSVVAPALSPDGRMLAFIRGENTFLGDGDVYVKLLPDGEPVPLTHDRTRKMGPLVFSPDGSRIAYSVQTSSTWTVPVFGGEPTRMLANAGGLSWFDNDGQRRILFSAGTGEGVHMGLFAASESRAEERPVYVPADVNGMAHRSFLSPDHKSVLAAEMDISGWLPCRLLPFDGSSPGQRVGPQPSLCTDAAWSPDGKWMYFSANTGGGYHIWRQRYPDGAPEQVTNTATEEQGISFAADGRSFVTSVGEKLSTIWVHDAHGEREITSQGYAFVPSFSPDRKRLYYLQRARANRRFVSGELWTVALDTGRRDRLLPDFLIEQYDVAPDGNHVTFVSVDDAGRSSVWIAALDGSVAPRRLSSLESVRARFGADNDVFFVGGEATTSMFLYRIKADGSGLQKISTNRALFLYDVSPDGRWASVWELDSSRVALWSTESGASAVLCTRCGTAGEENRGVTPPLVSWSRDGKYLFLHTTATRETFALPLAAGHMTPMVPEGGFGSIQKAAEALGAKPISDPRAFPSSDPGVYAFPRLATHRNIYRITVPQ